MTNRLMLGMVCIAMSLSAAPCAAGTDAFLGEIDTFAFNFCPTGWLPLNGQLLPISTNTALFSLLGQLMVAMEKRTSHCRQENRFSR